jgi:hypothetical protein
VLLHAVLDDLRSVTRLAGLPVDPPHHGFAAVPHFLEVVDGIISG